MRSKSGEIKLKKSLIVLIVALVSGCATSQDNLNSIYDGLLKQGLPEHYSDSYVHGCAAGYAVAGDRGYGFNKNVAAFDADSVYRQGWSDGFAICKSEYERYHR